MKKVIARLSGTLVLAGALLLAGGSLVVTYPDE